MAVDLSNCSDCCRGVYTPIGFINEDGVFKYNISSVAPEESQKVEGVLFTLWVCSFCRTTIQKASPAALKKQKKLRRLCYDLQTN